MDIFQLVLEFLCIVLRVIKVKKCQILIIRFQYTKFDATKFGNDYYNGNEVDAAKLPEDKCYNEACQRFIRVTLFKRFL